MAEDDDKIVGITAAMGLGTGLDAFGEKFPKRYFDVGIAEEHATTFAAGLAAAGEKPYFAIYSTFLQRAYDNVIHDVCLQGLPVKFMIDRAGLAISDGPTHHGIFDVAFLSHIPNMTILSPVTFDSLRAALDLANTFDSPIAIRYPNASEDKRVKDMFYSGTDASDISLKTNFDISAPPRRIFITYGSIVSKVIDAHEILKQRGVDCGIILLEKLKPYESITETLSHILPKDAKIVFVEEGIKNGGAGMIICDSLYGAGIGDFDIVAIDDNFAVPNEPCDVYEMLRMSGEKLAERFL